MAVESRLEKRLKDKADKEGAWVVKFLPFVDAGLPDRIVLATRGRFFLVEMKAPGGTLSPIQKYVHRKLKKRGHKVYVLWNREQVDNFIPLLK